MITTKKNKLINTGHIKSTIAKNMKIKIRAYPIHTLLQPLITATFTVLGAYFMYSYLFQGQTSDTFKKYSNTSDYISYIMIGSIIFVLTMSTLMNIIRNLISEMRTGTFESIFITDLNVSSYLLANMLERVLFSIMEIAVLIAMAIPFGLHINRFDGIAVALGLILTFLSLYGMSVLLWGLMITFRDTTNILNVAVILINLLCGIVFPIQYLPSIVQKIAYIIPTTYSVDILRATLISGGSLQSQLNNFVALAVLTFIYCVISTMFVKKILKKQLMESFI